MPQDHRDLSKEQNHVIRSYIKHQNRRKENSNSTERKISEAVPSQRDKSRCILIQDTEVVPKFPKLTKKEAPTVATTEFNNQLWSRLTLSKLDSVMDEAI